VKQPPPAALDVHGEVHVIGGTKLEGNVQVIGGTKLEGNITATKNLGVAGSLAVTGNVDFGSNGSATIRGPLRVMGAATFDEGIIEGDTKLSQKYQARNVIVSSHPTKNAAVHLVMGD